MDRRTDGHKENNVCLAHLKMGGGHVASLVEFRPVVM